MAIVVLTVIALALAWWTRWLAHRPRIPGWLARVLRWAFIVIVPAPAIGLVMTAHGLIKSFQAVEAVDASQKARLLAEGISEAMNATAFVVLMLFVELVILLVLTAKYHWSKAPRMEVPGSPPYR